MRNRFIKPSIKYIWTQRTRNRAAPFNAIVPLITCMVLLIGCVPLSDLEAPTPVALSQPNSRPTSPSSNVMQIEVSESNSATLHQINGETVIEVQSPKGIGNAQLQFDGEQPSKSFTVRLYLQGLEHFQIDTNRVLLTASMSSLDGSTVIQEINKHDGESTAAEMEMINADSPYWLEIEVTTAESESAEDGFIDVRIPEILVSEGETTMTLNWVDFYR